MQPILIGAPLGLPLAAGAVVAPAGLAAAGEPAGFEAPVAPLGWPLGWPAEGAQAPTAKASATRTPRMDRSRCSISLLLSLLLSSIFPPRVPPAQGNY